MPMVKGGASIRSLDRKPSAIFAACEVFDFLAGNGAFDSKVKILHGIVAIGGCGEQPKEYEKVDCHCFHGIISCSRGN